MFFNSLCFAILCVLIIASAGIMCQSDSYSSPPACQQCLDETQSLVAQARQFPNQLLEFENGSGDGLEMLRSCASNQSSILLYRQQTRSLTLNLATATNFEVRLVYSNDGPNTRDQVDITVNDNVRTFQLDDTRGDCFPGDGWNHFVVAGPVAPVIPLNAGQNTITVTVTSADSFGVELDALLLFSMGN